MTDYVKKFMPRFRYGVIQPRAHEDSETRPNRIVRVQSDLFAEMPGQAVGFDLHPEPCGLIVCIFQRLNFGGE